MQNPDSRPCPDLTRASGLAGLVNEADGLLAEGLGTANAADLESVGLGELLDRLRDAVDEDLSDQQDVA